MVYRHLTYALDILEACLPIMKVSDPLAFFSYLPWRNGGSFGAVCATTENHASGN